MSEPAYYNLGDMLVVGKAPAKLIKALTVIAHSLHAEYDRQPWIAHTGKSKSSCVLTSLTVRNFLRRIGFIANVRPVFLVLQANQFNEVLHSAGIGDPAANGHRSGGYWNGHMVASVLVGPGRFYLIDTTLYPAHRDAWDHLPGMVAVSNDEGEGIARRFADAKVFAGLTPLAGFGSEDGAGYSFQAIYLDNPNNKSWRQGPDAHKSLERRVVVERMVETFGEWEGVSYVQH